MLHYFQIYFLFICKFELVWNVKKIITFVPVIKQSGTQPYKEKLDLLFVKKKHHNVCF